MSLIYFMKHIKLPNTYNIIYRQPINVIANLMMTKFHLNTTVVAIFLDCKQSGFFSKSVKKSVMRGVRVLRARNAEPPDLLFDCSCVLEYTKIRTVLQSTIFPNVCLWRRSLCSDLVLTLKNRIEPPSYAGLCFCNMAVISFRLFRKNLGNLRDFFGQMVYRPPWQKISRTPMAICSSILLLKFFVYSK